MRKLSFSGSLLLLAGFLFAGCGESPKTAAPAQRAIAARAISAQVEAVAASVEIPGSVQSRSRIVLSSQINGFVRGVDVRAGDAVKAGQILVSLDAREAESQKDAAQAAIREAQAALEEARKGAQTAAGMRAAAKAGYDLANSTLDRYQKLFEARSVAPQEIDEVRSRRDAAAADLAAKEAMAAAASDRLQQVQARIEQAGAQGRRAEVIVGWTVVKAPAAGRVAERAVDPGSAVFPGSPLIVIESAADPQVLGEIPAAQLPGLRIGLAVDVRFSGSAAAVKGHVAEIAPLSNPSTHTAAFKVDLPAGVSPTPGLFARVEIPTGTRNALLIPRKAVREVGQLTGVFVVDGSSRARYRLVKIAPYDAERVELLSGVEPGERIVSPLADELVDGIALEVRS